MPRTGATATMARARSGTSENAATTTQNKANMGSGHVLFQGQQVANTVKVQITGPYQVTLSYQPLGKGTWQNIDLDPIVQFAWFSYALECGNVPQNILSQLGVGGGAGQASLGSASTNNTATRVSGRRAT